MCANKCRGRYRGDLDKLYVYDQNAGVTVPAEFWNRPLSKEDRIPLRPLKTAERKRK